MIVRQFISWIRTAPAGERAEATRALARAWLISDLSAEDRAAAEGALLMQLDDASPLVRQAMAEVFARSNEAPAAIVQALSLDQPSVAPTSVTITSPISSLPTRTPTVRAPQPLDLFSDRTGAFSS